MAASNSRASKVFDKKPIKVLRVQHDFDTIIGSVMHNASGANQFQIHVEDFGTSALVANTNLPVPKPNDFLGQWYWFEFYVKVLSGFATAYKMWIDDTLYTSTTRTSRSMAPPATTRRRGPRPPSTTS
jgi:hypothetical protein